MTYLTFVLFSTLEFFAIIYFGLSLFNIRLTNKRYIYLGLLSFGLSVLSLSFKYFSVLEAISPIIFIVLLMILVRPLTKITVKLSFLVVLVSYILYALFQGLLLLVTRKIGLIHLNFEQLSFDFYLLMIISSVLYIVVGLGIKYFTRDSFVFNPDQNVGKLKYSNKLIALILIFSLMMFSALYFEAKTSDLSFYLYIFTIVFSIVVTLILYILYKRDVEQAAIDSPYIRNIILKEVTHNEKTGIH